MLFRSDLMKCNTESEFINKIISKESNFFKNSIIAISRPSGNINKIEENIKNKEKIFNLLENNSSLNIIFRYIPQLFFVILLFFLYHKQR